LIQVLATCVHGQRLAAPLPGASVVIVGLGVTGLLHLQLAKLAGAAPVIGITRSAEKLRLAERLGADLTVAADAADLSEQVQEATGGGAELVIECAGSVATLATAVRLASIGGRILAYGTIPQTTGELPFYELYYKELVLTHPRSARAADFPLAIDAVAAGTVRLEPLESERFPLAQTASAIDAARRPGALKILVDP
jgi:L-iditol 2-dehydrogenase